MPLSYEINRSFEQGVFPNRLKTSVIKPIFKKGDSTKMENYRPITLIPVLAKIFEKVMVERMNSFLSKNNILVNNQFGFRKGSSTTQACFSLVKQITESLNNKLTVLGLFLDMSKAFDFVCHTRLLWKLQRYGIRGRAYEWLLNYLSNRNQFTEISKVIGDVKVTAQSTSKINDSGVPQGSILGPLLFLLYINDLPSALKHDCILFADDTTLLIKSKDKNTLEAETNDVLKNIIDWLDLNNLKINLNKTSAIQFLTRNAADVPLNIKYENSHIQKAVSATFLGITIDQNLNWKEHVDGVCEKLDRFAFALRRLRLVASKEAALAAYHGYVSSVLRYGLIIWGNSVEVQRAFLVQKKCIRAICGAGYIDPCRPLFEQLKILPLPCQYILGLCMYIKNNPNLFPLHIKSMGKSSRDLHKLFIPSQRLKLFSNNVHCMAIKVYNRFPSRVRALPLTSFKLTLTKWLHQKCFYSIKEFFDAPIDDILFFM